MIKNREIGVLLSVVVPVYNVEQYLNRCIESIRNQNYKNLEIILVDDGSTDDSPKICDVYAARDKRIKVIHKENEGLVSARKVGIQIAAGEYVTYVDSDDWIAEDMYEIMMQEAIKHNADIITSGLYRDYETSSVIEIDNIPEGIYDLEHIEKEILPVMIYTGNFFESGVNIHLYNKLFKRKIALENQLQVDDKIRVADDAALVYPCILDAKKIVVLHKCFYHYCIRKDSTMGRGYQEELEGYQKIYKLIGDKIRKQQKQHVLMEQLHYLMVYCLLLKEPQAIIEIRENRLFPFYNVTISERMVIYGGGKFGTALYRYLTENKIGKVVLWVNESEDAERGITDVSKLIEMSASSYDKVIIAVLVKKVTNIIQKKLIENGINESKIAVIDFDNVNIKENNYLYDKIQYHNASIQ